MKTYKTVSGFSLIELMVVVGILGIISVIAIPAYTGYIKTARMTEAQNNIAALKLAEEEFFLENNNYFDGENEGELNTNSGGLWTVSGSDNGSPIFDYAVTVSGNSFSAQATGKTGTAVEGEQWPRP